MTIQRALLIFLLAAAMAGAARAEPAASIAKLTVIEGDYGGGRIYAPMRVGAFLGQMRLDTGASTSRVKLAPWNKDFPVIAQSASIGAAGARADCQDVEAKNVAIKADLGNDIMRGAYEMSRCAASAGDDLLGLDFFKNSRIKLDLGRREISFFAPPMGAKTSPLRPLGPGRSLVGVDLRIGDVATIGLIDTGAEICAVDLAFLKKHRKLFVLAEKNAKASEAGGRKIAARLIKIKALDVGGGVVARDLYALVYDFGPLRAALGGEAPVILGYNFLSRIVLELDLRDAKAPTWSATLN